MAMIIAQGEYYNEDVVITVEGKDNDYTIDVEPEFLKEVIKRIINDELKREHAMGGTYNPERKSLLNIYNVLQYYTFEENPKVIVKGDIGTLPYEPDVIY